MTTSAKPRMKINRAEKVQAQFTLDALDTKICEILYEFPATTYPQLAALTGATIKQIRWRLEKPAVRKKLENLSKTKEDLIKDAKVLGLKKLMRLMYSKDDWVALQACKIVLAGELMHGAKYTGESGVGIIFETQVGDQGQIIQTATRLEKKVPQIGPGQPTTLDLVVMAGIARQPESATE